MGSRYELNKNLAQMLKGGVIMLWNAFRQTFVQPAACPV